MVRKNLLLTGLLFATGLSLNAQTVANFEDLTLSTPETSYLDGFATDGVYPFQSGNVQMAGEIQYGGTYRTALNYSNYTDSVNVGGSNMWSAKTAIGYNSSTNYGIAYMDGVPPNWTSTVERAFVLDAGDQMFHSMYVTNSTWAYEYISDNYTAGDSLTLTIRGYKNNTITNTINFHLAQYTTSLQVYNTWEFIDLTTLGLVDSMTVQLTSSDGITPFYFAFDEIVTSSGTCDQTDSIWAASVSNTEINAEWEAVDNNKIYEVAIDETFTDAPDANTTIDTTSLTTFTFENLNSNTTYAVHVRSTCNNDIISDWKVVSIKTDNVGIAKISKNQLSIYPNPVTDFIQIDATQYTKANIYNVNGQLVLQAGSSNRIDVSQLSNGLYIIKATDKAGNLHTAKFSKQ